MVKSLPVWKPGVVAFLCMFWVASYAEAVRHPHPRNNVVKGEQRELNGEESQQHRALDPKGGKGEGCTVQEDTLKCRFYAPKPEPRDCEDYGDLTELYGLCPSLPKKCYVINASPLLDKPLSIFVRKQMMWVVKVVDEDVWTLQVDVATRTAVMIPIFPIKTFAMPCYYKISERKIVNFLRTHVVNMKPNFVLVKVIAVLGMSIVMRLPPPIC